MSVAGRRRALIAGITGQDGALLTQLLLQRGYAVSGLVRHSGAVDRSRLEALEVADWNVTIVKQTSITERAKVEFLAEFFNLLNHVQFADPGTSLGNPQFGIVSSTMNSPRLVQLGMRLAF